MIIEQISTKETILSVEQEERFVTLQWADGHKSIFHYIWLRDRCPKLVDSISKERLIDPATIPADVRPEQVYLDEKNQLILVWANDQHRSEFDSAWLRHYCYSEKSKVKKYPPKLWKTTDFEELPQMNYEDIMGDEKALKSWLKNYVDYGFALLENIPCEKEKAFEIAQKVSYIFNPHHNPKTYLTVKSKENAKHLAFTTKPFPLHTDDAFIDPAPPVTIVLCLANDTKGGESLLVDGFKVATVLRETEPEKFRLLSQLPVHLRKATGLVYHELETPLIRLNGAGELYQVRFANHAMQPFQFPPDVMEDYYAAYKTYSNMLSSSEYQIEFRLKPGSMYMVNNHRLVHGRKSFSKGGNRHLQVCYLGHDGILSTLRLLSNKKSI